MTTPHHTHTHTGREKGEEREQSKTQPSGVVKANEGSVQGWHRQPFHVVKKRGGGGGGGPGQAGEQKGRTVIESKLGKPVNSN